MLAEKRHEYILQELKRKGSITVNEIKEELGISESTIRRDLNLLDEEGKLVKVFGGAVSAGFEVSGSEPSVTQKREININGKKLIAKYAAGLIEPDDFVYMDAGTTTGCMIDYITEKRAVYVTNAVTHARNLAALGFRVILIGGELKGSTEAVVGIKCGFTTPDINEAEVKKMAMCHCNHKIILADSTKFDNVSSVTFARIDTAKIITDEEVPAGYRDYNIYKVNG